MARFAFRLSVLCSLVCVACRSASPAPGAKAPEQEPSSQLVVVAIFDQMGSDALGKLMASLHPEGAIRSTAEAGLYVERARYPYAGTFTAPGHATIHTGAAPSVHGVTANQKFNYETRREEQAIDDGVHPVYGRPDVHAGPALLNAETLADALSRQTEGTARAVSLSLKDRAAILGGGQSPSMALWYDKKVPGFTTSSHYAPALPDWVVRFQRDNPLDALLTEDWVTQRAEVWSGLLGPDDAPGEGDWAGLGTTFPHALGKTSKPYSTLRATPQLGQRLLALAEQAVTEYGLGADGAADLLAVSISGTDYVGHALGPDSWQYADYLYRLDLALGRLLHRLAQSREVAVLITADHGAVSTPEATGRGGRVMPGPFAEELDGVLDGVLGAGDWVVGYFAPFVYLTPEARAHAKLRLGVRTLVSHVRDHAAFEAAFDVAGLLASQPPRDPLQEQAFLSAHASADADLLLVPAQDWVVDVGMAAGGGTTHGTPHAYDTDVPVFVRGPGVPHERRTRVEDVRSVAPTAARLLGIAAPRQARHPPLF